MSYLQTAVEVFDKTGQKILNSGPSFFPQTFPRVDWLNEWDDCMSDLQEWIGGELPKLDLREALVASPTASQAIQIIVDQWASLPIQLLRDGEPVEDDPRLQLITGGRKETLSRKLADPIVWGLYASGLALIKAKRRETGTVGRGEILKLKVLDSRYLKEVRYDRLAEEEVYLVNVDSEADGYSGQYQMELDRTYVREVGRWVDYIRAEDAACIKIYNPTKPPDGLPLAEGARRALLLEDLSDTWMSNISSRSGRRQLFMTPKGLNPGEQITDERTRKAQRSLNDRFRASKAAKEMIFFLTGAYDTKEIDISPGDTQLIEATRQAKRDVASTLGVSPLLLSDVKSGSLTDAGVDAEVKRLLTQTVLPRFSIFLSEMSDFLLEEGEEFAVDTSRVPALEEDRGQLESRARDNFRANGIKLDEFRSRIGEPEDDRGLGDMYSFELTGGGGGSTLVAVNPEAEARALLTEARHHEHTRRNGAA